MIWRIALIDSCGAWPGAAARAFASIESEVREVDTVADPTGHGTAIASLLTAGNPIDLLLGQVFLTTAPATGASVAAAVDWAVDSGARLLHLSLGLSANRPVLREAVSRAVQAGCVLVASAPARGGPVYPASYPGVVRGTGDARCHPGQWALLEAGLYGACPRAGPPGSGARAGASVGAAWLTRAILALPAGASYAAVVAALDAGASYRGRERRTGGDLP